MSDYPAPSRSSLRPTSTSDRSVVDSALDECQKALINLHETIDVLNRRLTLILSDVEHKPSLDVNGIERDIVPAQRLVQRICERTLGIVSADSKIQSIIGRLEL